MLSVLENIARLPCVMQCAPTSEIGSYIAILFMSCWVDLIRLWYDSLLLGQWHT